MGAIALQLAACGNASGGGDATGGGDAQDSHEPARPEPIADDAADDVADDGSITPVPSTHHAPPTRVGGIKLWQDLGVHGSTDVPSDANLVEPESTADDEPVVTPDTGWEAARCIGVGTRHVRISGNLDAGMTMPPFGAVFSADKPWETAAFGATFTAFDDHGRAQFVTVHFVRLAQGWDYHVVLDGTAFVIGEGHLSLDEQGASTVEVRDELRLLTSNGPGEPVELDLSGMTQLVGFSNISALEADGQEARWGAPCTTAQPPGSVTGPSCAATPTTRISLRANLAAADPVADDASVPPTSVFKLPLQGNDAEGTLIDFELGLRKSSAETWDYQVLLAGDEPGPEVASGSLSFNPNGSLHSVVTTRQLRFPNHDGVLGEPIELDFGAATTAGGNGVDGVTSFAGGSFVAAQQGNGAVLGCLPPAPAPVPNLHTALCVGERTTAVAMGFNLDSMTPLGNDIVYSVSTTVYDAALAPQQIELRFQHVEASLWQCRVMAAAAEIGVVDLHFAPNGAPQLFENIPVLRLPLADGSVGPPIHLGFEAEWWAITSFASETQGWLTPNGGAPLADGCAE